MPTRRELLVGAIAIAAMMRVRSGLAKASQRATPVDFDVPAGACDCHAHIHGDPDKFPFFPGRAYTPETVLPEDMAALHKALHVQRMVIVTPSAHGTDDSATLCGMSARCRGHRRQDAGERARRHGPGRRARDPTQCRDRRRERPVDPKSTRHGEAQWVGSSGMAERPVGETAAVAE